MDRRKQGHHQERRLEQRQPSEIKRNFLLAFGERLTQPITVPSGPKNKKNPYTFDEAKKHLISRIEKMTNQMRDLPQEACPHNEAVAIMTLHPAYIAKSFFPIDLLRSVNLSPVGSRSSKVIPRKYHVKNHSENMGTAEFFVSGNRKEFYKWVDKINTWSATTPQAYDLTKIEDISILTPENRMIPFTSKEPAPYFEIVLHVPKNRESDYILKSFQDYLAYLSIKTDLSRRLCVSGLCFMPLQIPKDKLNEVLKFSYIRVVRGMPQLRPPDTILRTASQPEHFECILPDDGSINPDLRVAVFDGGLPNSAVLNKWVEYHLTSGITSEAPAYQKHGFAVTSALLFGPLKKEQNIQAPFGKVDHYCVIDRNTNSIDLYDVLDRIKNVLMSRKYEFVNLSIGPDLPVEDNDVHSWTAVLDEYLSNGQTLASIAIGNNGENDIHSGNARIQIPSDCVNALSVGACDSQHTTWKKASYSALGFGRRPGFIKPDIVAYGGTPDNPFWVLDPGDPTHSYPQCGTSFAAPEALRSAVGVKAHFGSAITPLALKALLIHHSERNGHRFRHVGWGRIPGSIENLVICKEGVTHILYQGELDPAKYLRAPIPLPEESLDGNVKIKATICYASETDPSHAFHYTRSGLEVIFRPHTDRRQDPLQQHSDTASFFRPDDDYLTESDLKRQAYKWETAFSAEKTMRGSSLKNPVFDIHYIARTTGLPAKDPKKIPYALVITIETSKYSDIYERILNRYRTQLQPLTPVIEIPIENR